MTRSHIKSRLKDGEDEAANYFLLCDVCHREQPDGLDKELQMEWLKDREDWFVRTSKIWDGWMAELSNKFGGNPEEYISQRVKHIKRILKEGFSLAAGWANGRSNVFSLLKRDYREWAKTQSKVT